jgi:hypothetical protein
MLLINLWRCYSVPACDNSWCNAGKQLIGLVLYILVIKISDATYDKIIHTKRESLFSSPVCDMYSTIAAFEKCHVSTVQIRPRWDPFKNSLINHRPEIPCFIISHIGRSHWPRGLRRRSAAGRLLTLWVRIPPGHRGVSLVSVVCCQVEVSATSWSLVWRNPTDCGVSLCVI